MGLILAYDGAGLDHPVQRVLDDVLAPLQVWAGKTDGVGRWTHVAIDDSFLATDIVGDSWVLGNKTNQYTYTIIGNTMILNWYLDSSTLTIASTNQALYLRIPDDYECTSVAGTSGRFHVSTCWFLNAGTLGVGLSRSGLGPAGASPRHVLIQKLNTAAPDFVTGSFLLAGQLAFEIVPKA